MLATKIFGNSIMIKERGQTRNLPSDSNAHWCRGYTDTCLQIRGRLSILRRGSVSLFSINVTVNCSA